MAEETYLNYNLPTDAYLNFDADSFKTYMVNKLSENKWFTDQQFEGSNLNNLLEILSYSNHVLLFYLNQTSKESLFSDVQLYENINRIVKLIGYNPLGFVASTLSFTAVSTLDAGTYSIPRYSFFAVDGVYYSLIKDGVFVKSVDGEEILSDFNDEYILYNGKYEQLSDYSAVGEGGEIIELSTSNKYIDNNTINVYVKRDGVWTEWSKTENLYFSEFNDKNFTLRVNASGNYDIIFGDGINGDTLQSGDVVRVYYLNSQYTDGEVSSNFLNNTITLFSTPNFTEVLEDVSSVTYITSTELESVNFTNELPSTNSSLKETTAEIKENAPIFYQSQNRLLSKNDFTSFIKNNYGGIISSVKVINNRNFLNKHIAYLSSIGVVSPFEDSRVLANQYSFSSPCNFNNVYIYAVPRVEQKYSTLNRLNYLNPAQKQAIIDSMENTKELSLDIIIQDPVYMGVDVAVSESLTDLNLEDIGDTTLKVVTSSTNVDVKNIKQSIVEIFTEYFLPSNFELGQTINISDITNDILSIDGVSTISTINGSREVSGINLYVWDVVYDTNYTSTSQSYTLDDFQYAFFYDLDNLSNRITVTYE